MRNVAPSLAFHSSLKTYFFSYTKNKAKRQNKNNKIKKDKKKRTLRFFISLQIINYLENQFRSTLENIQMQLDVLDLNRICSSRVVCASPYYTNM